MNLPLQIALARASDLAREGNFAESEQIIAHLLERESLEPEALDLLARIRAHQGRYDEARRLWNHASAVEPGNESYKAALDRIAEVDRLPHPSRVLQVTFVCLVSVLIIAALGYAMLRANRQGRSIPRDDPRSSPTRSGAQISAENRFPLRLDLNDATVKNDNQGLNITFHSGLFTQGTELGAQGKEALDDLGRQLKPKLDGLEVNVRGHTSDSRLRSNKSFRDNAALGMQRAVTVIEYLRSTHGLPGDIFVATSSGDNQPPYSNDSRENRLRNQTVTLRILRKSGSKE